MSRIAAFGDCHIGSYGTKTDPATGLNARMLDGIEAVEFVLDDSAQRGADAGLFAGDAFRTAKPTPTELSRFRNCLQCNTVLDESLYAISGNHDLPRAANEAPALEPIEDPINGLLYLLDTPDVYHIAHTDCQLAVLPYPNRARLAASAEIVGKMSPEEVDAAISAHLQTVLAGLAAQIDPAKPSILMAHISLDLAEPGAERGIMAGRDITIPLAAIPEAFTFVVLGHIHYAQDFAQYGRPNVFYTGSTTRIDFGEEDQEKSYVLMDTDAGTWERVPIPCRRFTTLKWAMDGPAHDRWWCYDYINDAICRVKIERAESEKPDYDAIRKLVLDAGAFEFAGFTEDVERAQQARSEEIAQAEGLPDLLTAWHENSNCELDLNELTEAAEELEGMVA